MVCTELEEKMGSKIKGEVKSGNFYLQEITKGQSSIRFFPATHKCFLSEGRAGTCHVA